MRRLVEEYGEHGKWAVIAGILGDRNAKQCRERCVAETLTLCSCCSPPNQGSVTANATASCAAALHVQYCRWHNILKPGIIKRPWTDEEDNTIFTMIAKMGKKWTVIAAELPGR